MKDYILEDLITLAFKANPMEADYLVTKMIARRDKESEYLKREADKCESYCGECDEFMECGHGELYNNKAYSLEDDTNELSFLLSSLRAKS